MFFQIAIYSKTAKISGIKMKKSGEKASIAASEYEYEHW